MITLNSKWLNTSIESIMQHSAEHTKVPLGA